ncbi:MAG: helix-turn-helix transcriptional regulator [Flammeovirgaceae bacterium]|nr:helix-turn-helix transcriptional regulator [Flammeovirgaceae bacterium]
MTSLYIKNMVCPRCITAVGQEFEKLGLHPAKVSLGEVTLEVDHIDKSQLDKLESQLKNLGFELIDNRTARLIELIKNHIIKLIHHTDQVERKYNWSKIISEQLHHDYNYLSSLFSSVEGITLEQYIIHQKIERVKELLFYDELTLSEIANKLGYSSVAHLSVHFKKITGLTPSELKKSKRSSALRNPLDSIG